MSKRCDYVRKGDLSKIENYELAKKDNFKGWDIHHRLELTLDSEYAHSVEELKRLGMYYNRPYFELIFLKRIEHSRLHNKFLDNTKSNNGMYGKHIKDVYDEETYKKWKTNIKERQIGDTTRSEFYKKFVEHFKTTRYENPKLYNNEYHWYKRNGVCRWEKQ